MTETKHLKEKAPVFLRSVGLAQPDMCHLSGFLILQLCQQAPLKPDETALRSRYYQDLEGLFLSTKQHH